ncbi:hypothetical protein PybrP1_003435 [[Pythium] brassicae (nom. inval.)]|nr:hypothetical protein PybrP1_003435 [[Pythium] brassicae (nom. inval.)]
MLVQDQLDITCALTMQTSAQKRAFEDWCECLVMDWTHGTNSLGYHLAPCVQLDVRNTRRPGRPLPAHAEVVLVWHVGGCVRCTYAETTNLNVCCLNSSTSSTFQELYNSFSEYCKGKCSEVKGYFDRNSRSFADMWCSHARGVEHGNKHNRVDWGPTLASHRAPTAHRPCSGWHTGVPNDSPPAVPDGAAEPFVNSPTSRFRASLPPSRVWASQRLPLPARPKAEGHPEHGRHRSELRASAEVH